MAWPKAKPTPAPKAARPAFTVGLTSALSNRAATIDCRPKAATVRDSDMASLATSPHSSKDLAAFWSALRMNLVCAPAPSASTGDTASTTSVRRQP